MRESETFNYIRRKYPGEEEKWRKVTQLVKFDENLEVKSVHDFNINCYISTFGRLIRNGILCNMAYGDKYDISSMFTDTDENQVRFKRHQIVMQTFFMGDRRRYDTVDHINNMERFDNSIYNLRWADKGVQCGNRKDKPGKHRMVICIGDEEEIFFSCREAERLYNLPPNSVGKVCRGELESIYGYRFGYL
jgi:hypothetical protein